MLIEAQPIHQRPAWNTGRIIGPKLPLKPRHILSGKPSLDGQSASVCSATAMTAFPSSVGMNPSAVLWKSVWPVACSRARRRRPTVGWLR
jgi:hypothetical protein